MTCTKARYRSKGVARTSARQLRQKGRALGRPYRCPECSIDGNPIWHLTTGDAVRREFNRASNRRTHAAPTDKE